MPRGTWVEPGMKPSFFRSRTSRMSTTWTSPRAISASRSSTERFSMRVFASSTIWPMVFLGFHMAISSVRYRRTGDRIRQRVRGGEALDVLRRAVRERVRRTLEPAEPTVHVALEDPRGVRHQTGLAQRLQARSTASLDQHRAAKRLLAVRGDDRRARNSAAVRV